MLGWEGPEVREDAEASRHQWRRGDGGGRGRGGVAERAGKHGKVGEEVVERGVESWRGVESLNGGGHWQCGHEVVVVVGVVGGVMYGNGG